MLAGKEKVARSMDREINNQELELVAHERLPGLRFYVTQLKYCEFHVHIDAEFGLLLDGHAKVHTMQKDIQLKRGDFFYFNFLILYLQDYFLLQIQQPVFYPIHLFF